MLSRFAVKVYQRGDERLVEFSKREGCTVIFNRMYRAAIKHLETKHQLRKAAPTAGCRSMPTVPALGSYPKDFAFANDGETTKAMEVETVNNLLGQARCPLKDVRREAWCALANMSSSMACHHTLVKMVLDQQLPLLRDSLLSDDNVVREKTCLFLVNVCKREGVRSKVCEKIISSLFSVLELPGSLENRRSKRHAAKILQLVSESHAKDLVASGNCVRLMQTLERYKNYQSDPPLASSICATLDQVTSLS